MNYADLIRWFIITLAGLGIGFVFLVILGWWNRMFKKPVVESYQPRHVTFAGLGFILIAVGIVWARLDSLGMREVKNYEWVQLPGMICFWFAFYYIKQFIIHRGDRVVTREKPGGEVLVDRVYADEKKEV